MKELLSILSAMILIGTASTSIVVTCGDREKPPTLPVQSKFQKITGWTDTNGGVISLVNVNGTVYAGTITNNGKGNLYKNK